MILLPYLSVIIVLVLVQLSVRHAMGPVVSIGDEGGYICCGKQADPYLPGIFLRVPFMAWMSKQAHRYSSNPERVDRLVAGSYAGADHSQRSHLAGHLARSVAFIGLPDPGVS